LQFTSSRDSSCWASVEYFWLILPEHLQFPAFFKQLKSSLLLIGTDLLIYHETRGDDYGLNAMGYLTRSVFTSSEKPAPVFAHACCGESFPDLPSSKDSRPTRAVPRALSMGRRPCLLLSYEVRAFLNRCGRCAVIGAAYPKGWCERSTSCQVNSQTVGFDFFFFFLSSSELDIFVRLQVSK